jgi:membrane-associated phospholipid phosphatase
MPDHLALDEQLMLTPTPSRRVSVARCISGVLSPFVISFPFVVLIAFYHAPDVALATLYASVTLFFLIVGPMIYIVTGVRMGKFTDADLSLRTQRTGPFLLGIGSALAGLLTLTFIHGPKNLETLLLITILSGGVMMLTTLWWKISIHASSLACAVTMLTALYGNVVLPTFLLLVAVCWSRVVLRKHTLAQVIVGSLVSIVLATLVLAVRGI